MVKSKIDNNSVLRNLLFELLGEKMDAIFFDVSSWYTIVCFGVNDTFICTSIQSVIDTLVSFGIAEIIDFSNDGDGVLFYKIVFK